MKAKNYLVRLAAVLISAVAGLTMPLYAAEQNPMLKLEDAIKSAIVYSTQVSINSKEHEALREQLKLNNSATYYQYQSLYLNKAKNEQQKKMLEDQITNDISNKYNTIIILQKEIQLLSKNIDIHSKELRQMAIKSQKGLVNPIQYQSKEIELINLKSSKQTKEEELKNAQVYFKIITGKDLTRYTLEDTIPYETFRIIGSTEGYINSKISIYLQYDKELAKLKEDNLLKEGDFPVFYADYLTNKTAAETVTLKLEDTQKTLKQSLINSYSSLLSLEEQIASSALQLEVLDKKLRTAEIRYRNQLISVIEYDKQVTAKQEAELNLLKLISQYNSSKEMIQKPWIGNV
ncbi:TolC family protein [Cellulosilyticum sp. I15G10I2]|uniref:TolC family protein n=1 Tax=Cellulosilyticum sp. I15G10I2 TaxID=1892843 RepID=UPI00085C9280|nr:TolC family protein [Cellulosilyticum sp. I15G10I2]